MKYIVTLMAAFLTLIAAQAETVKIAWDFSGDPSKLTGFEVWWVEQSSTSKSMLGTSPTAQTATVFDLEAGKTYNIWVIAKGTNGLPSSVSPILVYSVPDLIPPPAPTNVRVVP
jgi:hypothetical protein